MKKSLTWTLIILGLFIFLTISFVQQFQKQPQLAQIQDLCIGYWDDVVYSVMAAAPECAKARKDCKATIQCANGGNCLSNNLCDHEFSCTQAIAAVDQKIDELRQRECCVDTPTANKQLCPQPPTFPKCELNNAQACK